MNIPRGPAKIQLFDGLLVLNFFLAFSFVWTSFNDIISLTRCPSKLVNKYNGQSNLNINLTRLITNKFNTFLKLKMSSYYLLTSAFNYNYFILMGK